MMRRVNQGSFGTDPCEFPNCNKAADFAVFSRNLQEVLLCCQDHSRNILDEQWPEYIVACDNCDCLLPVN